MYCMLRISLIIPDYFIDIDVSLLLFFASFNQLKLAKKSKIKHSVFFLFYLFRSGKWSKKIPECLSKMSIEVFQSLHVDHRDLRQLASSELSSQCGCPSQRSHSWMQWGGRWHWNWCWVQRPGDKGGAGAMELLTAVRGIRSRERSRLHVCIQREHNQDWTT